MASDPQPVDEAGLQLTLRLEQPTEEPILRFSCSPQHAFKRRGVATIWPQAMDDCA